jgi:MFS family permease
MDPREPLFSARFFAMCAFTFTVFVSAFMLLPTAPFQILAMGGSESQAGLFLGLLTYASAFSAPLTGAIADRIGKKRMLVVCSLAIAGFSTAYALSSSARALLLVVPFHGLFWSGLLSASSAYMTDILPEARRAEGIGYWGLSTMFAIAMAPGIGFVLLRHGWLAVCAACAAMNLVMAAIAASLVETEGASAASARPLLRSGLVEWRVVFVSLTLFLYSFGYGGITSFVALFAEESGVSPKGLYFPVLALVIILTRPVSGRLADRIGHRKVFLPCLVLIAAGLFLLALASTRLLLVLSALVFGAGFGTAYPVYAAYVMKQVTPDRRGAAFGAILAAFDTGIGTGSIASGWLIDHFGFRVAFTVAALLSTLSIPYFLFSERRFLKPA